MAEESKRARNKAAGAAGFTHVRKNSIIKKNWPAMKTNLSVSKKMRIYVNQHKLELICRHCGRCTAGVVWWGGVGRGVGVGGGSKVEEITYIVSFLALAVVESAGLAVAASLGVVPVVPGGGAGGARRHRGAWRLVSVRLVLGVQSGKRRSTTQIGVNVTC